MLVFSVLVYQFMGFIISILSIRMMSLFYESEARIKTTRPVSHLLLQSTPILAINDHFAEIPKGNNY